MFRRDKITPLYMKKIGSKRQPLWALAFPNLLEHIPN